MVRGGVIGRCRALAAVAILSLGVGVVSAPLAGAAGRSSAHETSVPTSVAPLVDAVADPATGGYWLAASNGAVFAFGAPFYGSAGSLSLNQPIVGMAATPDGGGYWLVARDGGIFAYGDARFQGSMGGRALNQPIVGMAGDPATGGYWLVAADGGIFAFGAPFLGSTGAIALNKSVVGMAATPDGGGYWLVAADGGIFAFGDAPFAGSTGSLTLAAPITGMAPDPATGGYWLVAADGGIFAFGAPFYGSAADLGLARAAVALVPSADGRGYLVAGGDGGIFAYGSARYQGSVSVPPLAGEVVAIDPGHNGGNAAAAGSIDQLENSGGFQEACDTVGTATDNGYAEHAFNFDVATQVAALLVAEGAQVVLTRTTDTGVGPCVDQRAAIGNDAHADAAISIHADGGPASGRGFDVTSPLPVVSSISNSTPIVAPSQQLAVDVRNAFAGDTGEPPSNYSGQNGLDQRADLGGLNLSTVPKVLIECANMRNATDAGLVQSATWRAQAAQGIAGGLTAYLAAELRPA